MAFCTLQNSVNSISKMQEIAFQRLLISKFSGAACPRIPLDIIQTPQHETSFYGLVQRMTSRLLCIDYISTECKVCTEKYLLEVFVQTERWRSEVYAENAEGKYFPVETEQTRLIWNLVKLVSGLDLHACFYLLFLVFLHLFTLFSA